MVPSHQPPETNQIYLNTYLLPVNIEKCDPEGRLHGKPGLERCLSVTIAKKHQKFLGKVRPTSFSHLIPFGLASPLRTFTKLLHPVGAEIRSKGIILYLDHVLVSGQFMESAD